MERAIQKDLNENSLTKEDQIIAFADIYQALIEDRPIGKVWPLKKSHRHNEKYGQ